MDPTAVNVLALLCLSVLWLGVSLEFGYKRYTSNAYLTYFSSLILATKTIAVFGCLIKIGLGKHPVFSVSPIEALMCLFVEVQYDNNLGYIRRTVPKFGVLMLILGCFVLTYTAMGFLIFNPSSEEATEYFPTMGTGFWNMLMMLNGSNWPGPILPALVNHRAYFVYFFLYIVLVGWGLLNLVLGFVYLFFQQELRDILEMQESTRVDNKAAAFRILDVEKKGFLTYQQVDELLKEMYDSYESISEKPSAAERYELILVLDIQNNMMINENDFFFIEQKCFKAALKVMRAKKRKFARYVAANLLKEQAALEADPNNITSSEERASRQVMSQRFSIRELAAPQIGSTENAFPPGTLAALARAQASALAAEVGVIDSRISKDSDKPRQSGDRPFSSTIEDASTYAGKIDDPKLLELYKSIEVEQLRKLKEGKALSWSQQGAFYAMQLDSIYFDIITDTFILIFGIGVLNHPEFTNLVHAYIAFSLFEMVLKLLVKGQFRYWRSNRNAVDGFVTVGLLLLAIGDASVTGRAYSVIGTKILVLVRTLLYPRNILVTNGFKEFRNRHRLAFTYAFNGAGHFSFLLLVLVVWIYVFAGLGMRIFGGAITHVGEKGERVAASQFGQAEYYPLNFNDIPSGIVTAFTLLSVNDMHVTASGFVAADSQWAEVFFACWYALGVLLLLNVLTAVFVNQFTGYMSRLAEEKQQELAEAEQRYSEAQHALHEGGELSEQSSNQSAGDLVDLSRNTMQNAHVSRLTTTNVLHDGEEFIGAPDDAPPGVFFSPPRPSFVSFGATPRHSEALPPGTVRRAGGVLRFGTLTSSTGLGLLAKMLTIEDTPEEPELFPPGNTLPGINSPMSPSGAAGTERGSLGNKAPSRPGSTRFAAPLHLDTTARESLVRPRASTVATGGVEAATDLPPPPVAGSFNASIFASDSDRSKLNEWVRSHYPKPRRPTLASHTDPPPSVLKSTYGAADSTTVGRAARQRSASYASEEHSRILAQLVVPSGGTRLSLDAADSSDDDEKEKGNTATTKEPSHTTEKRETEKTKGKSMQGGRTPPLSLMLGDPSKVASLPLRTHPTVLMSAGGFEMRNVSSGASSVASDSPPQEVSDDSHNEEENVTSNPLISAQPKVMSSVIHSTQEELQHLRSKKSNFFGYGGGSRRQATQSLQEWMYGTYQITKHERAAVLIQFARDGEEHSIFSSPRGLACFRLRTSLAPLFKICSFIFALLKFFQRPLWTYYHDRWDDSDVYPVSGLPQLSALTMGALKLPLLLVMLFGLLLELGYKESSIANMFKATNGMRIFRYLLAMNCVAQIVMVLCGMAGHKPELVTITSFGSMAYLLWFNRRSLHKFRVVMRIIPHLTLVLIAFLLLVLFFAGFGPYIFNLSTVGEDDDVNMPYFDSFGDSTWSVFVAITSSNYPNQVLPAYRRTREVFLYFFVFISVGSFCMLNLILVIVMVEFQKSSQLASDIQRATCQVLLMRAFEVLDPDRVGHIERDQLHLLLDELYLYYSDFKKAGVPQGAARDILIDILDVDGDGKVTIEDFLFFLDVTRIKVSKRSDKTFLEVYFPTVVATSAFQMLAKVVKYPYTNMAVDFVVTVLILTNIVINSRNSYHQTNISITVAFTAVEIIVFEALCKIAVLGYAGYRRSFRNRIDFAIASTAAFSVVAAGCYQPLKSVNGFTIILRIALMLRLFLFPRNIRYFFESRGLKRFSRLLRRILSKTLTLSIVFLCTGYFFATVGMFLYGGKINRSPEGNSRYDDLVTSRYGEAGFYPLNFNDFMSASITLFCCLHVSDFDTVASGFTATTNSKAKVFFIVWYVVGVLLLLNILKSFFLGEFLSLFLVPKAPKKETNIEDAACEASDTAHSSIGSSLMCSTKIATHASSTCFPHDSVDSAAGSDNSAMRETYVLNLPAGGGGGGASAAAATAGSGRLNSAHASLLEQREAYQRMLSGTSQSSKQYLSGQQYDEEVYKKIALSRESGKFYLIIDSSTFPVSEKLYFLLFKHQYFILCSKIVPLGQSISQSQQAANIRYIASTSHVKVCAAIT